MARTYWTFTLNNPTNDETVADLECLLEPVINYACFQLEIGDNKTIHYQGFLKLKINQRLSYVKKLLPRAHWEPVKAVAACRNYCMKEETRMEGPWELGEWTGKKGTRTDLLKLKKRVLAGERLSLVKRQCVNHQQVRFLESMAEIRPISRDFKPRKVFWFWGKTGTGKTRTAYERIGESFWRANLTGHWFNGYQEEEDVLIDDLRAKNWPYDLMLLLLDGYQLKVPTKGGFTLWNPSRIFITCPYKPQDAYSGQFMTLQGDIDQLLRRITAITEFTLPKPEEDEFNLQI